MSRRYGAKWGRAMSRCSGVEWGLAMSRRYGAKWGRAMSRCSGVEWGLATSRCSGVKWLLTVCPVRLVDVRLTRPAATRRVT